MRSAIAFLPDSITVLTNLVTRRRVSTGWSVNLGSGSGFRFGTSPLRGIDCLPSCLLWLLGPLGAVLRTALATVGDAGGVQRAANDVIANAGQVLDTTAADQHHGVLLQVVPFARDIGRHLHPVGQPHAGDLAQRRVRLLGRGGVNTNADASPLRARLQRGRIRLSANRFPAEFHKLIDGGHARRKPRRKTSVTAESLCSPARA